MRGVRLDLVGERFGRYTVVEKESQRASGGAAIWKCLCDCGEIRSIPTGNLRSGASKSCGCLHNDLLGESRRTHGMSHLDEYGIWNNMLARCDKDAGSKNYAGRGISVCAQWADDFRRFYSDMGPRPSKSHSIDRIDNNGNYSPDNCRWATTIVQSRNTRRRRGNTSGLRGVSWDTARRKWISQITVNGERIYVGASRDFFEICCLRFSAERKYWKDTHA